MTPNLLTCAAAAHATVVAKVRLCEPKLVPERSNLLKDLDIVIVMVCVAANAFSESPLAAFRASVLG